MPNQLTMETNNPFGLQARVEELHEQKVTQTWHKPIRFTVKRISFDDNYIIDSPPELPDLFGIVVPKDMNGNDIHWNTAKVYFCPETYPSKGGSFDKDSGCGFDKLCDSIHVLCYEAGFNIAKCGKTKKGLNNVRLRCRCGNLYQKNKNKENVSQQTF